MFVKPLKGRSVPDPARGDLLPSEGRNVEESSYWFRRIAAVMWYVLNRIRLKNHDDKF
ncbi:DUF2635 domain-containing protein [Shigella flexneri]|uniref:DUF2635 domain-containing protein n=1 Tax=Shigella flexneri TaxID=623 RepID=UPI000B8CF3AD|nr:DUF2635 domain-containing protein [Shigella flexneri]